MEKFQEKEHCTHNACKVLVKMLGNRNRYRLLSKHDKMSQLLLSVTNRINKTKHAVPYLQSEQSPCKE